MEIDEKRIRTVKEIINSAKKEGRGALLFQEACQVMKEYGIKTVDFWTKEEKEISFPSDSYIVSPQGSDVK